MKVHFTASLTGKKYFEKNYKEIVACLKELDCHVVSRHIFASEKQQIMNESVAERQEYHRFLESKLSWYDVLVAEVSYPSSSVGYEIAFAIKKNKPVLLLYDQEKGDYPSLIKAHDAEDALVISYAIVNLKETLKESLCFLKTKSLEKRFTMLMSPKLLNRMDKVCQKQKLPRSVYIRKLIEENVKKKAK